MSSGRCVQAGKKANKNYLIFMSSSMGMGNTKFYSQSFCKNIYQE